jgi:hypothetical protein
MAADGGWAYTAGMRRLAAAVLAVVLTGVLGPVAVSAQDVRTGRDSMEDPSSGRPPAHRPRPPIGPRPRPFVPCCVAFSYLPAEPPPPAVVLPPPVVYVVPSPPTLAYVPPPRVEPAPEIQQPGGRWERHGNGKEYPYTWVWQPSQSR